LKFLVYYHGSAIAVSARISNRELKATTPLSSAIAGTWLRHLK